MYWESETDYTLWKGKRLVGTVEVAVLPNPDSPKTIPIGWTAIFYPPDKKYMAPTKKNFTTSAADAKAWIEARLKREVEKPEATG